MLRYESWIYVQILSLRIQIYANRAVARKTSAGTFKNMLCHLQL